MASVSSKKTGASLAFCVPKREWVGRNRELVENNRELVENKSELRLTGRDAGCRGVMGGR